MIIPKEGNSAALNSCLLDVYFVYLTIKTSFHNKVGLFLSPSFKKTRILGKNAGLLLTLKCIRSITKHFVNFCLVGGGGVGSFINIMIVL